jgi:hypothetical protein
LAFALTAVFAVGAALPADDLIRQANAAFLAGDIDQSEALYAAAEERTGDPGLVSFNKAAVLFQKGEYREADIHYARTLDDAACPADRAARSWFNRGVCLVHRGGSAAVLRTAIACFERCLDAGKLDSLLQADARYNLELAKLLWAEANRKAVRPESPNAPSPEEEPPPPPLPNALESPNPDPNSPTATGKPDPRTASVPAAGQSSENKPDRLNAPVAGESTNPPLLPDDASPQSLTPNETREFLRQAEARLRDERLKMLKVRYGPDRPGVRDW